MLSNSDKYSVRSALLASFCLGLLALGLTLGLSGCDAGKTTSEANPGSVITMAGATMGTSYHVTVVGNDTLLKKSHSQAGQPKDQLSSQLQAKIDARLRLINQQMSTYIEDSELNQLQRTPLNEWQPLSTGLANVLSISRKVSELSDGAFDITVRPLIDLWGFGPDPSSDTVPEISAIDAARAQVDYQALQLQQRPEGDWQILRSKTVDMDLSAVAKGYGVDQVAELLVAEGFTNFMVEIGGELKLAGVSPRGKPWRIAIERPQSGLGQDVYRVVSLTNMGMATSGDYRNYFEQQGVRYSHTIDPRTGRPITHKLASVTVLHPSAAYADALATAFDVMGENEALKLAEQEKIAAFFIVKTAAGFKPVASQSFKPYLAPMNAD